MSGEQLTTGSVDESETNKSKNLETEKRLESEAEAEKKSNAYRVVENVLTYYRSGRPIKIYNLDELIKRMDDISFEPGILRNLTLLIISDPRMQRFLDDNFDSLVDYRISIVNRDGAISEALAICIQNDQGVLYVGKDSNLSYFAKFVEETEYERLLKNDRIVKLRKLVELGVGKQYLESQKNPKLALLVIRKVNEKSGIEGAGVSLINTLLERNKEDISLILKNWLQVEYDYEQIVKK